jgi:hypothetical protein
VQFEDINVIPKVRLDANAEFLVERHMKTRIHPHFTICPVKVDVIQSAVKFDRFTNRAMQDQAYKQSIW